MYAGLVDSPHHSSDGKHLLVWQQECELSPGVASAAQEGIRFGLVEDRPASVVASESMTANFSESELFHERERMSLRSPNEAIIHIEKGVCPLNLDELEHRLIARGYDDTRWVMNTLRNGACLQHVDDGIETPSMEYDLPLHDKVIVRDYVEKEVELKRVVYPISVKPFPRVKVSPKVVVDHQNLKVRTCTNSSAPWGRGSVNEGIPDVGAKYPRISHIIQYVLMLGLAAQMFVIDVASAYRLIPVHPKELWLCVFILNGLWGVDLFLSFGCKASVSIW